MKKRILLLLMCALAPAALFAAEGGIPYTVLNDNNFVSTFTPTGAVRANNSHRFLKQLPLPIRRLTSSKLIPTPARNCQPHSKLIRFLTLSPTKTIKSSPNSRLIPAAKKPSIRGSKKWFRRLKTKSNSLTDNSPAAMRRGFFCAAATISPLKQPQRPRRSAAVTGFAQQIKCLRVKRIETAGCVGVGIQRNRQMTAAALL